LRKSKVGYDGSASTKICVRGWGSFENTNVVVFVFAV